jgi:hypothetical protein
MKRRLIVSIILSVDELNRRMKATVWNQISDRLGFWLAARQRYYTYNFDIIHTIIQYNMYV